MQNDFARDGLAIRVQRKLLLSILVNTNIDMMSFVFIIQKDVHVWTSRPKTE